jgi:DNA-binding IclR family transcriptional regulator
MDQDAQADMARNSKASGDAAPGSVRALDRGLTVLDLLASSTEGLSAPELAERAQLSRATVYRLLTTLVARGYVATAAGTSRYWVGPAVDRWVLGHESRLTLSNLARPEMEHLAERTRESVGIHIRDGHRRIAIRKVEPPDQALRYVVPVGSPRAVVGGATGAVLLLDHSRDDVADMLARCAADPRLDRSRLDADELWRRIEAARVDGFCQIVSETVEGIASVAAPVRISSGRIVAALVVSGPVPRFGIDERLVAAENVVASANRLGRSLS